MLQRLPIVITPWFPTATIPYAGSFVVEAVKYLGRVYGFPPLVVHLDDSYQSASPDRAVRIVRALGRRSLQRRLEFGDRPGFAHMPLPVKPGAGWAERAETARVLGKDLATLVSADPGRFDIHAHVGVVSGPASLSFPEGSRVYMFEHASFLLKAFTDDRVNRLYASAMGRAHRVFCVNPDLADDIRKLFPAFAHKVAIHPNAVDFARFDFHPRTGLTQWLYLGNLKASKGTWRMVEAVKEARRRGHQVTLTMVGRGEDSDALGELAAGPLRGILFLRPGVAPEFVPSLMAEAELLVHLSEAETFGLTAIEAVASGLPVLATSTSGSEQAIRPIQTLVGRLVSQPGTAREVVDAYEDMLRNRDRLDLKKGRRLLERRFGPRHVAQALADQLQEVD